METGENPTGPRKKNGHYILGTGKGLGNREGAVREVLGLDYRHLEYPSK